MRSDRLVAALVALVLVAISADAYLWMKIKELGAMFEGRNSEFGHVNSGVTVNAYMCARRDWCGVDFTRLAAHPELLVGRRVFILGYLAVDHGVVSLFASEEDYLHMEDGRSLEIGGNRRELTALVETHGNKYVRIEGTYELPPAGREGSARLGALVPPIIVREFHPRRLEQGVNDILVRVRYPDEPPEGPDD